MPPCSWLRAIAGVWSALSWVGRRRQVQFKSNRVREFCLYRSVGLSLTLSLALSLSGCVCVYKHAHAHAHERTRTRANTHTHTHAHTHTHTAWADAKKSLAQRVARLQMLVSLKEGAFCRRALLHWGAVAAFSCRGAVLAKERTKERVTSFARISLVRWALLGKHRRILRTQVGLNVCVCVYIHTYMHSYMHAYIHKYTHPRARTHTHAHTHTQTHTTQRDL